MFMLLVIALGGAIGAVTRYSAGLAAAALVGPGFQPAATMAVNIVGSGLMGLCYGLLGFGVLMPDALRGFIMVGFLGALTTFSSFSLDAVSLIEKGEVAAGLGYIIGSVILSLVAFLLVMLVTRGVLTGH